MKMMKQQLIELLNIKAHSGEEKPVRDYLIPILKQLVDKVFVDEYGNLLGEKKCGTGKGAVLLLSAHMDTVKGVLADRILIEEDGVIKSNKGALGADDRAGIAIILEVLRNVDNIKSFNGVIKLAFTRQEEIGCIGSDHIDPRWYKKADLAIVVDRRGNRDIVVGCGMAFCSNAVGEFMEEVSALADMDWKCVEGGISDAMTFAQNGVNSINLSAGYRNEHTDKEYVVLDDMMDTVKLILQAIAVVNQFYHTFGKVPAENRWVKRWDDKRWDKKWNIVLDKVDSNYGYSYYFEDEIVDSYVKDMSPIWAEESDLNGDVYVYEIGREVIISQGNTEIVLSRETLKSLVEQLQEQLFDVQKQK